MVEEYNSIMMNDVWEGVPRSEDRSVVGSQWIYKIKYDTNDSIEKYKARFMANGLAEEWGNLPWTRKVRYINSDEIHNAGLLIHGYSHDHQLEKIDALEDKEVDPTLYRQLIGSLMYLVNTRPDICFAVNTLNQFMVEPKRVHWAVVRHILRYVRRTGGYGLKYSQGENISLNGFTDADWVGR
eukprot:PITA_18661